jgi:hypothetical protein
MKVNDVITIVTIAGEYIGKFKELTAEGLTVGTPRVLIQQDGELGFAKGVCMTGKMEPDSVVFKDYVYFTETDEEFAKNYHAATSGIIL